MKEKKPEDDIFNLINPTKLNEYLSSLMPGLTAKVFRTFNASNTLQQQLDRAVQVYKSKQIVGGRITQENFEKKFENDD